MMWDLNCLPDPEIAAEQLDAFETGLARSCKRGTKTSGDNMQVPAEIIHVVDGDTLYARLRTGGAAEKIRLADVDAPECKKINIQKPIQSAKCIGDEEYLGLQSYEYLRNTVENKQVDFSCVLDRATCECTRGYYGRIIGRIALSGRDMSELLVQKGLALTYTTSSSDTSDLCRLEKQAQQSGVGMWHNVKQMNGKMKASKRATFARHLTQCGMH